VYKGYRVIPGHKGKPVQAQPGYKDLPVYRERMATPEYRVLLGPSEDHREPLGCMGKLVRKALLVQAVRGLPELPECRGKRDKGHKVTPGHKGYRGRPGHKGRPG
jgi:hypothetical protein